MMAARDVTGEDFHVSDGWSDSDAGGMSSGEEEDLDRQAEESDESSREEEVSLDEPGVYEDLGDSGGRSQSPTRKRAREGTPDNGSSTKERTGTCRERSKANRGAARACSGRGRASRGRARACRGRDGTDSGRPGSETEAGQNPEKETPNIGFGFPDEVNVLPPFTPCRPPGIHFEGPVLRGGMTTELEFFRLFLTPQMVSTIVTHTNTYALIKVGTRGYTRAYLDRHGFWNKTTDAEINKFIALLIYFGLVKVGGDTSKYWSTKTIYHGLWARKILSRNRYDAISAFLHVVDPNKETPSCKLGKVEEFLVSFKARCKLSYQPTQKLAVDERMVKSKHRSGIKQYMKDKPTKSGLKLWVLADSDNGYTVDFNVYIGKDAAKETSENGLSYDVVMTLMEPYLNQGYNLYLDNFYTSPQLLRDLFLKGTPSVGTVKSGRKEFPECLRNVKTWAKRSERGNVRWIRHSPVLALQWIDCKPVSILSTLHSANDKSYRDQHSDVEALQRVSKYSIVDFREALIRQICGWPEYDDPPASEKSAPGELKFQTDHIPVASDHGIRRNCVVCYREGRGQKKVITYCSAPQCQKFLHIKSGLNCFKTWHSPGYKRS